MPMKVCVVGAGLSGLITMRYLLDKAEYFDITTYEQTPDIGGTWVYTDKVGTDEKGMPLHSSMYRDLRTNVPKEIMACPGFNYPEHLPSFITWREVLQYMQDFTSHYGLKKYIKFRTIVKNVSPIEGNGLFPRWKVLTQSLETSSYHEEEFDAVIVCSGHFSVPFIPDIPGLDTFTGKFLHSKDYRTPEVYKDQVVVCIGAMSSGQDIALGIAQHAKKVYLSSRSSTQLFTSLNQANLEIIGDITEIKRNKFFTKTQNIIDNIDAVIVCTGYKHAFPFLSPVCCPLLRDYKIEPLYLRIVHADYPTLFFIGLLEQVNVTSTIYVQANYVVNVLQNIKLLPSREEMHRESENFYNKKAIMADTKYSGAGTNKPLRMVNSQWEYYNELATMAGFEKIPDVVKRVFEVVVDDRYHNLLHYRDVNYRIVDGEFQIEKAL